MSTHVSLGTWLQLSLDSSRQTSSGTKFTSTWPLSLSMIQPKKVVIVMLVRKLRIVRKVRKVRKH